MKLIKRLSEKSIIIIISSALVVVVSIVLILGNLWNDRTSQTTTSTSIQSGIVTTNSGSANTQKSGINGSGAITSPAASSSTEQTSATGSGSATITPSAAVTGSATATPGPSSSGSSPSTSADTSSVSTTTSTSAPTKSSGLTSAPTNKTGASLYVSPSGNDANPGTAASPFKSIQKAIESAAAGSTIVVKAGTYRERLIIRDLIDLEIKSQTGERPVLNGQDFNSGYLIEITASQNISFSGFEVRDFKGADLECVIIKKSSSNVTISNNIFHNIGTTASNGNAHIILARGNENVPIRNVNISGNEIYDCDTGWSESVTMESNVDGFKIEYNKIHDVTNIAIDAAGFYDNDVTAAGMNQARNGRIAHNLIYQIYSPNASCAGIYVDGGRDIVIERNTVHHSMFGIEVGCENPFDETNPTIRAIVRNITVRDNFIYDNSKLGIGVGGYDGERTGQVINTKIYNNTLFNNRNEIEIGYSDNIEISKNIVYSLGDNYLITHNTTNKATNIHLFANVYFAGTGQGKFKFNNMYAYNLVDWQQNSGQDLDSIFSDPLFKDTAKRQLSLKAGSPATGKGVRP